MMSGADIEITLGVEERRAEIPFYGMVDIAFVQLAPRCVGIVAVVNGLLRVIAGHGDAYLVLPVHDPALCFAQGGDGPADACHRIEALDGTRRLAFGAEDGFSDKYVIAGCVAAGLEQARIPSKHGA